MHSESERIELLERAVKALIEDSYKKNWLLRNLSLKEPVRPITMQWFDPTLAQLFGVDLPSSIGPLLEPQSDTCAISESLQKSRECSVPR